jgi:hypothetical protein
MENPGYAFPRISFLGGLFRLQIKNPSCPLQALNSRGQQGPDDLQLKALRRDRMDLPRKQFGYAAEERLYVLANRLAQKLLSRWHWPL